MVAGRSDLPTEVPPRHELRFIAQLLAQKPSALLQGSEVTRFRGQRQATAVREVAFDPLFRDEAFQQLHRVQRELKHLLGATGTYHARQLLHLRLIALEHEAAVPAARTPPQMMPLEYSEIGRAHV